MLKQAKDALETKSLISPSKLPILSGPSISALQVVKLPKLELKDSMKLGSRTSPTPTLTSTSGQPPTSSRTLSSSSTNLPVSSSTHQKTVESSDCPEISMPRNDDLIPENNDVVPESDAVRTESDDVRTESSSDIDQNINDPPPLTLQNIQPVVTLTRLPSV